MSAHRPRVFSIDPGARFLPTFARALVQGDVIPGFRPIDDPLLLSDATIYVPTRRASRALAAEIQQCLPGRAAILPRIVPLGHMENIETGLLLDDAAADFALDAFPAVSPMGRRVVLTRFILKWAQDLGRAIAHVDESGKLQTCADEPLLVAHSPPQAWRLAGELAGLIDEMIIEGIGWDALKPLAQEADYDKYWGITLDFLKVAGEVWPQYLALMGLTDGAARQAQLVEAEVARLGRLDSSAPPVIAIGSTGTNKATAHLLASISRAPCGAVVLPGLDFHLDEAGWAQIAGDADGRNAAASHPQSTLRKLLHVLGVARADVAKLGEASPDLRARNVFLSEAMRPAETTERWKNLHDSISPVEVQNALADVAIIEAGDQREEALAIAIAIRAALEDASSRIALATPDRALAQRVRAELARWSIEVDDSGGESLGVTSVGALARLLVECADAAVPDAYLLALLNHPLALFGLTSEQVAQDRALLEAAVMRQEIGRAPDLLARFALAQKKAVDRHAHRALRQVDASDWSALCVYAEAITDALSPLRALCSSATLAAWLEAHRESIVRVMTGDMSARADADALDALEALFDELASHAGTLTQPLDIDGYAAFFDQLTAEAVVRGPRRAHPRVKILGLLEARLLDADLMILGGLDESVWPPQARGDPFLNRPMREQVGLSSPERRLGQTAHDFVQLMGCGRVLLSRSAKRDGAPTVPSRFLQRMKAVAGSSVWSDCLARGAQWIALAQEVDREKSPPPALKPPEPKPPVALRPQALSVTRIETLRRDPYSIYAERILELKPLQGLDVDSDARQRGTRLHKIVADFIDQFPSGALPPHAGSVLFGLARESFAVELADAQFRTFLWPRIGKTLEDYVTWEEERREQAADILVEQSGRLDIALADGSSFRLTAQADRIEVLQDGAIAIYDLKSGTPPSASEVDVGFAPQLTLEAAMVERGGFKSIPAGSLAAQALYVKLLARDGIEPVKAGKGSIHDLAEAHFAGLVELLNEFRSEDCSYPSRPYVKFVSRFGEYDHLARVKEWSSSSREGGGE
jgi:ATP-dependent helicase/nuclease subunit B